MKFTDQGLVINKRGAFIDAFLIIGGVGLVGYVFGLSAMLTLVLIVVALHCAWFVYSVVTGNGDNVSQELEIPGRLQPGHQSGYQSVDVPGTDGVLVPL